MIFVIGGILGLIAIIAVIVLIFKGIFSISTQEKLKTKYKGSPEASSVFVKKYPEVDVQKFSSSFFNFGLIFSLLLVTLAFSWTTYDRVASDLGTLTLDDEFEVEPPQTRPELPPPPPPPPPEIVVVEDEEVLDEEPEIEELEIEEDTEIEIPVIEEEPEPEEDQIFTIVEDMPTFPGGEIALLKYLASIPYPPMAKDNDIEGSVFIRFVVDKSGRVTNVDVARGADKILNDAAVKHISKMPKWAPGKQRGKPVKVQYVVPIKFRLD